MSFLSPEAFVFAAALPVVVVFYLLKRKRVIKLVSSTLLWQRFIAENQANRPFQKLRHNWLLVLQLLILVLVILALSRPYHSASARQSRFKVLILDSSASMQCTDVKPNRFEKARSEALKWVDTLRDFDQMVVLQAGAATVVKQSPTSQKSVLRRAIEDCAVSDCPTRLNEALRLAENLIKNESSAEIHLFSDGATSGLSEFENKNLPVVYHRMGERALNLGIVSLDVRANPDNPAQRAIFAGIFNPQSNVHTAELELLLDGQTVEVKPVEIPASNTFPVVFVASQSREGIFTVRINTADDLAVDNQASVVSRLPVTLRVLLVTKGNRFLEKSLRSIENVDLKVTTFSTDPATDYDIVVLDDVTPSVWPDVNLLAIHVQKADWFPEVGAMEAPAIVDWKNAHPLLRHVNFDNVQVRETLRVKTPAWGQSLVDSTQTPLLISGDVNRRRIIWIGFDVLQSTWPLRISFPIFFANAIEWLNPTAANASHLGVKAGEPLRLSLSNPVKTAQVIEPHGRASAINLESNATELVYGDTSSVGIYQLAAGTNTVKFCVNLLDAQETATQPRQEIAFGEYTKAAASPVRQGNTEAWRWIACCGLLIALFEWWYYNKRTAG